MAEPEETPEKTQSGKYLFIFPCPQSADLVHKGQKTEREPMNSQQNLNQAYFITNHQI